MAGSGSIAGTTAPLPSTGAAKNRLYVLESANNAAGRTSHNDRARGSARIEAELLTDVQQRLVLLSRDMDNHHGQRVPHQPAVSRN